MIAAVVLVSLTYVLPFLAVYLTGIPASAFEADGAWATVAGLIGGKISGIRVAALSDCAWRDDERVWDVQRAGDELLEAAAGDGARRHAAEDLCEDERENTSAVGGDSGVRDDAGRCAWVWDSSGWSRWTLCCMAPA